MSQSRAEPSTLRHGLTFLRPSEIAEQFYCEYKVHLKRIHPEVRIELPVLEAGEANHGVLASQAKPVTQAELEEAIRTGKKSAICEWALEGAFQGVTIRGRPDFLALEGKSARLVLEFKFTRGRRPFRDQRAQAEVYALLTDSMGFATSGLCFGIVMFPSADRFGGDAIRAKADLLHSLNENGGLSSIHERCEEARVGLLKSGKKELVISCDGWKAFLYRYDRTEAEENLTWALGYWREEREPLPVGRLPWDNWPRKCGSCPLNAVGHCEHALQRPDPSFNLQRCPDGRISVSR
jgi:hypothetical protein